MTQHDAAGLRIGSVLRERYRISGVIGAGGMATVYLAVHRNGNRVALKMLHPELSRLADHRERFVREAYVANSLDHPGAVRVIDDDVADDGSPFLVMELLAGETLAAYHERRGRLAPREVLAIGHALCDVLARAHARGVVHRDIKPDNIFLTTRGELKVLDFGIARVRQENRESGTQTGHLLGTPAFMPPEQALGRRHAIDGRSDLWSAGATMFTVIAGRVVHPADAPEEMMVRSATEPAPGLASVALAVPPAIAAVIDKALAFAPDQRFADAAAMQAAIAAAHLEVFGLEIDATPLPRGEATTVVNPDTTADTLLPDARPGQRSTEPGTGSSHLAAGPGAYAATGPGSSPIPGLAAHGSTSGSSPIADPVTHGSGSSSAAVGPAADRPTEPISSAPIGLTHRPTELDVSASPRRKRMLIGALALLVVAGGVALAVREAAPSGCTTNAECTSSEAPAICRVDQRRCVTLTTEHCQVLADESAVARDDTLWIGAMYPIRDPTTDFGREGSNCVDLARRDFQELTGGLPPLRPDGQPRPIGVIMCDDTSDHEASARHLVDDVGVPAVLGFGRSKEAIELANRHFVPKGVLALASNTAAMLSNIPHPPGSDRLVYRVTTSATMTAPPAVALVRHDIEPTLRGPGGVVGAEGTLRVAIVRSSNASGTSFTDALLTALAATPAGGREDVRPFMLADDSEQAPALFERAAAEIAAFAPHVVLDASAPTQLLVHLEQAWSGEPRPQYVFGSVDFRNLLAVVRTHADFSARFRMISTRDNQTRAKMRTHYLAAYGGGEVEFSPTAYDAFYVLAYAAVAAGDAPLTGRTLARAIHRLGPPGAAIEVGPAGIYPALEALARGANIDLRGTRTSLDFDPKTGDASADFAVFCIDTVAGRMRETDARYDAATGTFTAPARCP